MASSPHGLLPRGLALTAAALGVVVSCGAGPHARLIEIPEAPPPPPPRLLQAIDGHDAWAVTARDALHRGDLDTARDTLVGLRRQLVDPEVPADRRVYVYGMVADAPQAARAASGGEIGRVLGETVAWCGRCHRAEGLMGPPDAVLADPSTPADLDHVALAGATWDALVWPSSPAWKHAALAIDGANPPGAPRLTLDELADQDASTEDDAVRAMARLARAAFVSPWDKESVWDRVEVFSNTQGSCAGCHTGERDGITASP